MGTCVRVLKFPNTYWVWLLFKDVKGLINNSHNYNFRKKIQIVLLTMVLM